VFFEPAEKDMKTSMFPAKALGLKVRKHTTFYQNVRME
jgi:hypothetical protein